MFSLLTAALTVIGSILTIIIWLFSYKRRREARRMKILKILGELDVQLAKALQSNNTNDISTITARMRVLREEYRFLDRQR